VKQKINELKNNINGQKKKDLTSQHAEEMRNLEESFNNEFIKCNEEYEEKFQKFQQNASTSEGNLEAKHKRDMEALIEELEQKLPRVVKFSREYLDLKQSEMALVKQER
jgi:hypothetical protein